MTAGTDIGPAAAMLRAHLAAPLELALITGSGLAGLGDAVQAQTRLPYAAIPGWPGAGVAGHPGELLLATVGGRSVALALGRAHRYEGASAAQVTFAVRVFAALGAGVLIVTNSAGGLNPAFAPGDVMVLRDHLDLPGLTGHSPLVGPHDAAAGPRFPVLRGAYDAALAACAVRRLGEAGLVVRQGVYVMQVGPAFETPAEARFLRLAGADAVGMSTVPEVVVARQAGLRVLGLSLITNHVPDSQPAAGESVPAEVHDEVLAAAAGAVERLAAGLSQVIAELPAA